MSTRRDEPRGRRAARGTAGGQERTKDRPLTARYSTSWGDGWVTICDRRLVAVGLPGEFAAAASEQARPGGTGPGGTAAEEVSPDDAAAVERWVGELEAYFRGERLFWTAEEAGLEGLGVGEFQRRVYETLVGIPAGTTVSYGSLAEMAGFPRAARAVGTAMATNPIPVVVPCHRVIKSDGRLGNYGNDPGWKARLLEHERAHKGSGPS